MTLADTLRSLLKSNIVSFTFRKVDGTIRKARGTRNLDIARAKTGEYIPTPKGEEQPNSYYDIDKMGWRSYKPELLISIDDVCPVEYVDLTEEKSVKEIPIVKTEGESVELPPCFGDGTIEKIRKAVEDLGGAISLGGGKKGELPSRNGKVGKPTDVGYGVALPISGVRGGEMGIEDFAKLVAKFVVNELATRLSW